MARLEKPCAPLKCPAAAQGGTPRSRKEAVRMSSRPNSRTLNTPFKGGFNG